jgi:NAD(P)-dependent dehydrogenase (short-subunit alcohol dehydrogenase family)
MVQVAVITGASTGIGRATAVALANRGVRVLAGVRRDEDATQLREEHELIEPLHLDITHPDHLSRAVSVVERALSRNESLGLVNNAGIAVAGPVEFLPVDDFRRQFEVNLYGHIAVMQALLPLVRRTGGRIVNVTSIGGQVAQPFVSPYVASKHALEAVTDALRMELRPWRISVSLIEPGAVATPIWQKSLRAGEQVIARLPQSAHELYGRAIAAMTRIAEREERTGVAPEKVAGAICHALLSPRPRTRYRVGLEAHALFALKRVLPDRAFDQLLLRVTGLPR